MTTYFKLKILHKIKNTMKSHKNKPKLTKVDKLKERKQREKEMAFIKQALA